MKNIHLVGVSGIGMSAVAGISVDSGFKVSGSADIENEQTKILKAKGMEFYLGHKAEQIKNPDIVVRSAAVPENNPEVREAQRRNIPVYLYSEYLGMIMGEKRGVAVAGTHGKTTTTAFTAAILTDANLEPTVVCGGVMNGFCSNSVFGKGDYFISEACEYNRSFLDLKKWYTVVTNIENDHLDYYRSIEDIKQAFFDFLKTSDRRGFSVVNGDDKNIIEILKGIHEQKMFTVGFEASNQYIIQGIENQKGLYSFVIMNQNRSVLNLNLSVPGRFNCINAALSAVFALKIGVNQSVIEKSVNSFTGMQRRLEYLGEIAGNAVYSDYAHHPTEINFTLSALREKHPGRKICVVFQPHQYSRTAELFHDFVKELLGADYIILTEIYRQRDSDAYVAAVSSSDLFKALKRISGNKKVIHVKRNEEISSLLHGLDHENKVIVFMGAGDIDDVARQFSGYSSFL